MNGWALQEPGDEPSPFLLSPQPVLGPVSMAPPPSFEEELEELPDTYGTQALYLTACDPGRVFAYWDIDWSKFHPGDSVRLPCTDTASQSAPIASAMRFVVRISRGVVGLGLMQTSKRSLVAQGDGDACVRRASSTSRRTRFAACRIDSSRSATSFPFWKKCPKARCACGTR